MASADVYIELKLADLSRLDLRPGDVLVFRHEKRISQASVRYIKDECAKAIPGHRVMVLDDGLELAVLRPVEQGVESSPAAAPGPEPLG